MSAVSMARTAWAVLMAPWNRAVPSAGSGLGTHTSTTRAHPSWPMACSKCPIHYLGPGWRIPMPPL
jgi:hypothetical protein